MRCGALSEIIRAFTAMNHFDVVYFALTNLLMSSHTFEMMHIDQMCCGCSWAAFTLDTYTLHTQTLESLLYSENERIVCHFGGAHAYHKQTALTIHFISENQQIWEKMKTFRMEVIPIQRILLLFKSHTDTHTQSINNVNPKIAFVG